MKQHQPCPQKDCDSSDAYTLYDDGHGWCFSCDKGTFPKRIKPADFERKIVDGFRGIVGLSATGDFVGKENRLAEFNEFKTVNGGWEFSDPAVDGDFVHDRSKGVLKRIASNSPMVTTSFFITSP